MKACLLVTVWLMAGCQAGYSQTLAPLTVEKTMRDPKWIGTSPSSVQWSEDSKTLYFKWNPEQNKGDSLYAASVSNPMPKKVEPKIRRALPAAMGVYNRTFTRKVYEKHGDIYWIDTKTGKIRQVTNTVDTETNPAFSFDEQKVLFTQGDNLFAWNAITGEISQLTNFRRGKKADAKDSEQDQWLKTDQQKWMGVVKERTERRKALEQQNKAELTRPKEIYLEEKSVSNLVLSPDELYITYNLSLTPKGNKTAIVPSYVTASGYTENLPARTKVGNQTPTEELFVYDTRQDTVFAFSALTLPGIYDQPDYLKDYPQKAAGVNTKDTLARLASAGKTVAGKFNLVRLSGRRMESGRRLLSRPTITRTVGLLCSTPPIIN